MEVIERNKVKAEKELPPIKEEEEEDTSKAKAQVFSWSIKNVSIMK